jgi:hypothetical protein
VRHVNRNKRETGNDVSATARTYLWLETKVHHGNIGPEVPASVFGLTFSPIAPNNEVIASTGQSHSAQATVEAFHAGTANYVPLAMPVENRTNHLGKPEASTSSWETALDAVLDAETDDEHRKAVERALHNIDLLRRKARCLRWTMVSLERSADVSSSHVVTAADGKPKPVDEVAFRSGLILQQCIRQKIGRIITMRHAYVRTDQDSPTRRGRQSPGRLSLFTPSKQFLESVSALGEGVKFIDFTAPRCAMEQHSDAAINTAEKPQISRPSMIPVPRGYMAHLQDRKRNNDNKPRRGNGSGQSFNNTYSYSAMLAARRRSFLHVKQDLRDHDGSRE